jgi:hypothetical protein
MTHLLGMCRIKWQKKYDLNDHLTQLSTRALLGVPEYIKTNIKVDDKALAITKQKGLKQIGRWC